MPVDGHHTIQVFGNDSQGNIYESKIMPFIVDMNAPTSLISFTAYSDMNRVVKSTIFTITADDLGSGVSVIRYKINSSAWTDYNGPFDLYVYEIGRAHV